MASLPGRQDDPGTILTWSYNPPGRLEDLKPTQSGAQAIVSTNYETQGLFVFDPEVTDGYTRFDQNAGTSFAAPGHYVVINEAPEIFLRMGMENSQKRPVETGLEGGQQACLCYEAVEYAGTEYEKYCGDAAAGKHWGVVCLVDAKDVQQRTNGLAIKYIDLDGKEQFVKPDHDKEPETGAVIRFNKNADPEVQLAYEKGGGKISGLYAAQSHIYAPAKGQDVGTQLPQPKYNARFIFGLNYNVKMLHILHSGKQFTMDYNGIFYGGDDMTADSYEELAKRFDPFGLVDRQIEISNCTACSCDVPKPIPNQTLDDQQMQKASGFGDRFNASLIVVMIFSILFFFM
ncbi:hypothetical protein M3Y94_01239700 [Aphelenchoides besseyi]|nr:hypothetical protein M3Y94_01239700 [Aphelenchoides besseyi]